MTRLAQYTDLDEACQIFRRDDLAEILERAKCRQDAGAPGVLAQVVTQFAAALGMAQFAQGFGFDLAHALACDLEFFAYILKRAGDAIFQAKAHDQDLALALVESF